MAFGLFHMVSLNSVGTDNISVMCLSREEKTIKHIKGEKMQRGEEKKSVSSSISHPAILGSRVWLRMVHMLEG